MRAVLADTVVLYALVDPDDQHHDVAVEDSDRLREEGLTPVVPYPILLETHGLVMRWLGIDRAHAWLEEAREGFAFINVVARHYEAAFDLGNKYSDHSVSLYDLSLAVLASELDVPVWSYDRHFEVLGVPKWPLP